MRKNYVLIDYENVQPAELPSLKASHFFIKVFLGSNQAKIPVELVKALQPLGSNVEYIKLDMSGANALDFHVAYYLGVLSSQDPDGHFHVISKDTGFDPLIAHLRGQKISVGRCATMNQISSLKSKQPVAPAPAVKPATKTKKKASTETEVTAVKLALEHLKKMKSARPAKLKTLNGTLHKLLSNSGSALKAEHVIAALIRDGKVVRDERDGITYNL